MCTNAPGGIYAQMWVYTVYSIQICEVDIYVQMCVWRYMYNLRGDIRANVRAAIHTNALVAIYVQMCAWRSTYKYAGGAICTKVPVALYVQMCSWRYLCKSAGGVLSAGSKIVFFLAPNVFSSAPTLSFRRCPHTSPGHTKPFVDICRRGVFTLDIFASPCQKYAFGAKEESC